MFRQLAYDSTYLPHIPWLLRQRPVTEHREYVCDVCGEPAQERLMTAGLIGDGGGEPTPWPIGDFCHRDFVRVRLVIEDGRRGWRLDEEAA